MTLEELEKSHKELMSILEDITQSCIKLEARVEELENEISTDGSKEANAFVEEAIRDIPAVALCPFCNTVKWPSHQEMCKERPNHISESR